MKPSLIAVQVGLMVVTFFTALLGRSRKRWARLLPAAENAYSLWIEVPFPIGCSGLTSRLHRAGLTPVLPDVWMRTRFHRAMVALLSLWGISAVSGGHIGIIWSWFGAVGAYLSSDVQLQLAMHKREEQIRREFAGFLDLLSTSTGAGHSLYSSLEMVASRMKGPLGEVLHQVAFDMACGKRFSTAWDEMSERTGIQEIAAFRSTILEAEILGTPVADTLRTMAATARHERRNRVRSRVEALPLKLSLCTVIFFLPPIIIVLVLPNLLKFFSTGW